MICIWSVQADLSPSMAFESVIFARSTGLFACEDLPYLLLSLDLEEENTGDMDMDSQLDQPLRQSLWGYLAVISFPRLMKGSDVKRLPWTKRMENQHTNRCQDRISLDLLLLSIEARLRHRIV